jgi:glycosyltransferase involved in cell wall biosynthesis
VTLAVPERLPFLKRSLADYCRQTYVDRELIVVVDGGAADARTAIRRWVAGLDRTDIRVVETDGTLSLGALRNRSWDEARGEVICQWDDDDFHHPERIERQFAALQAADGLSTCLQEVMLFVEASGRLHLTNWAATPPTVMPATVMCRASAPVRYPEEGPESRLGEDLNLLGQLRKLGRFEAQTGSPHLYVYVTHATNTCGGEHHRMIAERLSVSKGIVRRREAELRHGLSPFDFGREIVTVEGTNGQAFTIAGRPNG